MASFLNWHECEYSSDHAARCYTSSVISYVDGTEEIEFV